MRVFVKHSWCFRDVCDSYFSSQALQASLGFEITQTMDVNLGSDDL